MINNVKSKTPLILDKFTPLNINEKLINTFTERSHSVQ